jgi:hypothetical protein
MNEISPPLSETLLLLKFHFVSELSGPPQNQSTSSMKSEEIAQRLVALCREQKWEAAQKELFADDAISIEPYATPAFEKETKGLPQIIKKGHVFDAMVETMHSLKVSDPVVATNAFACTMQMDVTMKGQGRMNMSELCVYKLKDGKITSEEFFV